MQREPKRKDTEAVLNRVALFLTIVGLFFLVIEIASSTYARLNSDSQFTVGSHFTGTDGYRIIAIIGFVSACGLVYSLGKVGRVMGLILAVIVLWQIGMWYSVYQSLNESTGSREFITMVMIGFLTIAFWVVCIPYSLLKSRKLMDGVHHHPAQ